MMLGAGGASKKYVDEVYSNYIWTGTGSSNTITNGIDLDGQGGMVWVKNRDQNDNHWLFANSLGIGNGMRTNSDADKFGLGNAGMSSFNSNGFTVGTHGGVNGSGEDIVSWTFRNSKAFQCLTYDGNGSARTISHSLGSVPGMVIVKKTDGSDPWYVWHRDLSDATKAVVLNATGGEGGNAAIFNSTRPTATEFSLGTSGHSNENNKSYIAYLFAGGESTASTAVSVDFDASEEDALTTAHSSDFDFGSGDFTVECWIKPTNASQVDPTPVSVWNFPDGRRSWAIFGNTGGSVVTFDGSIRAAVSPDGQFATRTEITGTANLHQWNHVAFTRSGNTLYFFVNGILQGTASFTGSVYSNTSDGIMIGGMGDSTDIRNEFDGGISNVRVVKGTAVYTSSFKPPTEPLTNITNTKLLCCNNSSVTGSTVTPGTITAHNSPTANTQSPFDDPAAYVFGEEGDQNIFKMGSYVGNGSATGPEVYVGWEPQYVLIKRIDDSEMWMLFDSMRGIRDGQTDKELYAQSSSLEYSYDRLELTSTGFRPMVNNDKTNNSSGTYVYFCVRRADGDVGKPVETGSAVFSMNSGSASGAPLFDSTHVVDYQFVRNINSTWNWETGARLIGSHQVYLNTNGAETEIDDAGWRYDYMNGWHTNASGISNYMCWMFKRHAGMDVVVYTGNGVSGRQINHSLGTNSPEMIWVKNRTSTDNWQVWHKDLTSGKHLLLNSADAETTSNSPGLGTVSTTTFNVGSFGAVNGNNEEFIALLFSSVSGVSKLGIYTGNGSSSGPTVTLGFQPRMVIIRRIDSGDSWFIFDTARGVNNSGNDAILKLNSTASETTNTHRLAFNSDDFTLTSDDGGVNASTGKYIYYAHA